MWARERDAEHEQDHQHTGGHGRQMPARARRRALATKTVSMSGTMSCSAPVVSMTMTVVVSVMRVAPPMNAAAPTCAQEPPDKVCNKRHAHLFGTGTRTLGRSSLPLHLGARSCCYRAPTMRALTECACRRAVHVCTVACAHDAAQRTHCSGELCSIAGHRMHTFAPRVCSSTAYP